MVYKVEKLKSKYADCSIFSTYKSIFFQNIYSVFKFLSYIFSSLFKNIKFDILFNILQFDLFKFYNYLY